MGGIVLYGMWIIIGYLSGSVMYAYLLPKLLCRVDVRKVSDDGNPGAANAFKYAGKGVGLLSVICELAKGFLPVFFAMKSLDSDNFLMAFVMIAPVAGHAFPIWKGIMGGKSIAVSFGVMLGLMPITTPFFLLAFFYILFSLVVVIYPHFYRSVITFVLYGAACFLTMGNPPIAWGCAFISGIVIYKHFQKYHGEKITIKIGL